jgi:hypothetical protein
LSINESSRKALRNYQNVVSFLGASIIYSVFNSGFSKNSNRKWCSFLLTNLISIFKNCSHKLLALLKDGTTSIKNFGTGIVPA